MKISVVTISYNQSRFLQSCIDSVANQDGPLEHIVVDPGSTDGSRDIIEANRSRLSHCVLERDEGPADGLNRGFAHATGEIFYYLNADDVVLPGAFAEARALFRDTPEVDVLSGAGYVIDEHGRHSRRLWSDPVSRLALAHGGSILIQPSTFIRREAFRSAGGFNIENRTNWDGELVLDLFEKGAAFRQVDNFWSGYRVHAESITGSASLHDRIMAYRSRMHKRITGREPGASAWLLSQLYRARRILRHPSKIYERTAFGPVYGGRK